MKAAEIEIGKHFVIRHDGQLHTVKVFCVKTYPVRGNPSHAPMFSWRVISHRTHWLCLKLATGRMIEVKSAQKFRCEVFMHNGSWARLPNFPAPLEAL